MSEQERTVGLFRQNFAANRPGRTKTVIYGMGRQTQYIIDAFRDYPIIGVLDGFLQSGSFCGKKVLSLQSLAGKDVQIVIAARKASGKLIYDRIGEFCRSQHIPVYDLQGNLMEERGKRDVGDNCFGEGREELLRLIDEHECVSFDVFDTLLTRRTCTPQDVFSVVGEKCGLDRNFSTIRLRAEKELAREGPFSLEEIYRQVGSHTGMTPEEAARVMEEEIRTERALLVPRRDMVEVYRYAAAAGKRVFILSDMYFSPRLLADILKDFGITGYEALFVSAGRGAGKADGLYPRYKMQVEGSSFLHIGDSEELDGLSAGENGMDSFLVKSPGELYELSAVFEPDKGGQGEWKAALGLFQAEMFNSPFSLRGSGGVLRLESGWAFGYGVLGPVMTAFAAWLASRLEKRGVDRIFFLSRDGFLVKQIYDLISSAGKGKERPKSEYLLFSRTLGVAACAECGKDVRYAAELAFSGTAEEMLRDRFHLEPGGEEVLDGHSGEERADCVMRHGARILERAAQLRAGYRKYTETLGIGKDERLALFDFVSSGTCQLCLEKLWGRKLYGYYFERIEDDYPPKSRLDIEDFRRGRMPEGEFADYFLFEVFIKEGVPSLRRMDEEGRPVYDGERRDEAQLSLIGEAQRGAVAFARDYLALRGGEAGEELAPWAELLMRKLDEGGMTLRFESGLRSRDTFTNRVIEQRMRGTDEIKERV